MRQHLSLTAVIVRDYNEAIAFFVGKLGFELREDTRLDEEKRWVVVAPPAAPRAPFYWQRLGTRARRKPSAIRAAAASFCSWRLMISIATTKRFESAA